MVRISKSSQGEPERVFHQDYEKNMEFVKALTKETDISQAPKAKLCFSHDKAFQYVMVTYTYPKVTYANYGYPVMLDKDWGSFRQEFNEIWDTLWSLYETHKRIHGVK